MSEPIIARLTIPVPQSLWERYRALNEKCKTKRVSLNKYAREALIQLIENIEAELDDWPDDAA